MGFLSLLLVAVLLPFSVSMQNGVYFEKIAAVVHTTEHHDVVIRLGFEDTLKNLGTIDKHLKDAIKQTNRASPFYGHFSQLTMNLKTTVHQLKTHVTDFFVTFDGYKTSTHQRSKRSNILGTFAARILGLATDTDLKSVIDVVNENSHKEGVINRVVSTVKITETHLHKVVKAINKTNLTVTSMKNHFQKLDKNMAQLDSAFVLVEALTFFSASMDTIDRTV